MKFRVKMDCQKQELEDRKGKMKAEKTELFENVFLLLDECFGAVTREVSEGSIIVLPAESWMLSPHVASCEGFLQEPWTAGQEQNLAAESASGKGRSAGHVNTATLKLQQKPCRRVL